MMLALYALSFLILYFCFLQPLFAEIQDQQEKKFQRALGNFELETIADYYPTLREMTYDEIRAQYHIDSLYHQIGEEIEVR